MEFEKSFAVLKKELKIKVTLEELDSIFLVHDYVAKEGFVSNRLERQIVRRIIDVFSSWINYLHGMLVPNPNSILNVNEVSILTDADREKITKTVDRLMIFSTRYNMIAIKDDTKEAGKYIDDSVDAWNKEISPVLLDLMQRSNKMWNDRLQQKPEKKERSRNVMYG
ncbi:MAG TPA: hypothetical protein VKE88_02860 [Candidatus Nanoarchaeia archaeon]|nr:hypothetical protein [Candidatus Nanoarchaeia archaeon]